MFLVVSWVAATPTSAGGDVPFDGGGFEVTVISTKRVSWQEYMFLANSALQPLLISI